uniref:hypothetical protein n=1 Tax=Clostridium sp. TaxID=1506 RepID=UPI00307F7F81
RKTEYSARIPDNHKVGISGVRGRELITPSYSIISTFFVPNFYENRRTTRITCSTVSLRFFRADAYIQ